MIAALIPARGGSKGVPRKNIRMLGGRPLLHYTIEAALQAARIEAVFVSTEDAEIAAVALDGGARLIQRPVELAEDETAALPVIVHALPEMDRVLGGRVETLVYLQATTPFRNAVDIDATIALIDDQSAESAVSVVQVTRSHPFKLKKISAGRLVPYSEIEPEGIRRQDMPSAYVRNGGVYVSRRATIESGSLYGRDCRAHVMSEEQSVEIDTELDFAFAEFLLSRQQ
jgi:CMP-N,N'-diacetyllegionaminic acid synthase